MIRARYSVSTHEVPMTRDELVQRIHEHEAQCALTPTAAFTVVEVVELAPGILAAMESDGEFTLYFDRSMYTAEDGHRSISGAFFNRLNLIPQTM